MLKNRLNPHAFSFLMFAVPACLVFGASNARAEDDYVIYSPMVTQGETEVELRGYQMSAGNPALDRSGSFGVAAAYSPTSWWKSELYTGPFDYSPTLDPMRRGYEWENIFQLADHGEFWADPGLLVSYVQSNLPGVPNAMEITPLLERNTEEYIQRLNVVFQKLLGVNWMGRYNMRASYMADYKLSEEFSPGIEAYYFPTDNTHQMGPGFSGEWSYAEHRNLEYSGALLYGIYQGYVARSLVLRVSTVF